MQNKYVLQIIAGLILFINLFPAWSVYAFNNMNTMEMVGMERTSFLAKLALLFLPLIGLYLIYMGISKRDGFLGLAAGFILSFFLATYVPTKLIFNENLATGYYLNMIFLIISLYTLLVPFRLLDYLKKRYSQYKK